MNPWFPKSSYFLIHLPESSMQTVAHDRLCFLANEVGAFIGNQYPFRSAFEAVTAYLDFRPTKYPDAYRHIQDGFQETFVRAFICSELERTGTPSAKALIPEIMKTPLSIFHGFLQTEELLLSEGDRKLLMQIIRNAGKDFSTALTLAVLSKLR